MTIPPLLILAIAVFTVLTLIIVLRFNAFLALIIATFIVSFLTPGEFSEKITRVALVFGTTAGKIGIIIAMAAIIGRCLIESGAADRIVTMFLSALGEKRCDVSLMSSGFILSIPVFFDTVFYLLIPLARAMHRRTHKSYLRLIMTMAAGAAITHAMVPPTPGPLIMADTLGINLGAMIMIGLLTAACTATVMLFFIRWYSRFFDIPMRTLERTPQESSRLGQEQLPGLFVSILPILLPVLLISAHTVFSTLAQGGLSGSMQKRAAECAAVFGNPNLAMLISAIIALLVYWQRRKPSRERMAAVIKHTLMSAGMIILITSAGGAFGTMLKEAQVGPAIERMIVSDADPNIQGMKLLVLGFFMASLLKFAQGSSTVSMITTSAMLAGLTGSPAAIGFHPVYLACAIGFGALCGAWMNDSGFWIFAKMSGLTAAETLKTWAVTLCALALIGFCVTLLFAKLLPLV